MLGIAIFNTFDKTIITRKYKFFIYTNSMENKVIFAVEKF